MASRAAVLFEFSRPFTLVAPALGFASGAATAAGAFPREALTQRLIVYPLIGLLMAAVLNAASNALNQIYDLDIDRINKPHRPLPSRRLSMRTAWLFTAITYAVALVLAWMVAPGGRHECFWIVVFATVVEEDLVVLRNQLPLQLVKLRINLRGTKYVSKLMCELGRGQRDSVNALRGIGRHEGVHDREVDAVRIPVVQTIA